MKKTYLTVATVIALGGSMLFSSCIGQFALTNKVLDWNNQVGSKFVNELVFFAFWILPVYEVTYIADLLVINSIEFWSGSNPMAQGSKVIDTDTERYIINCDGKGYDITAQSSGETIRLDFDQDEQTWSVVTDDQTVPFMTFVDQNTVKMITPEGDMQPVQLTQEGLHAYAQMTMPHMMAKR